jgi:hypothetical protein
METVRQARAALTAAKYQNGVPFLVLNSGTFGVGRNYDVCDFRKRGSVIREREAQLAQALENVERLKDGVSVQIERSLNRVERTTQMLQVASQVVKLRAEGEPLAGNQMTLGVVLISAQGRLRPPAAKRGRTCSRPSSRTFSPRPNSSQPSGELQGSNPIR